jgi:hypothetical protein
MRGSGQGIGRATGQLTAAFLLQSCLAPAALSQAAASVAHLSIADWHKTVQFRYASDRCTDTDTPDAPPRAFRDYHGQVHLFATHDDNRALVGRDFNNLHHPCSIVFRGRHAASAREFSDREWLTAFYTDDGRHIVALVHDEFQGNLRKASCPSGSYIACWENNLTLATSTDGGSTFVEKPAPHNLVASLPYRYQGELGRPIGYFQPSNIVRKDGHFYVMFHAEAFGQQAWGTCVARSDDIDSPTSWRGWDGAGFNAVFVDPYIGTQRDIKSHVCLPVGKGGLFDFGSLTYDETSKEFLAVTSIPHGSGNAFTPPGAYVATSRDLIHWSQPELLVSEGQLKSHDTSDQNFYGFFSLIDERSGALDFSSISGDPSLYLYFVELDQAYAPYARRLVKLAVSIGRP